MSSKVLIVGAPSEALRQELEGAYRVQLLPNPSEWEKIDPEVAAVAWLSPEPGLVQRALNLPRIQFLALVDEGADASGFAAAANVQVFPISAKPAMVRLTLDRLVQQHEREQEQRDVFETTVNGSVAALFEVLSIADPYSASLGQRLRYAVEVFAKTTRQAVSWDLENAALLAEIGVLTVPVRVIMKHQSGQELPGFEKDLITHVPERGADLLQQIPFLTGVAGIVRYQSKNFDGSGLPNDSVAGEKIPLGARVLKVVSDLFKWKENGLTHDEAILEMSKKEGRYDPEILELARTCFEVPANIPASTLPMGLKDLRPGQLLVSNVVNDDGVLLIRDGQVISPRLLHKLRNFAFTSGVREPIYVIDLLESRKMSSTFSKMAHTETSFFVKGR